MDQYRIRTEFSFRQAYGQLSKVIAAGKEVGALALAITDTNTFGHVSFYRQVKAAGMLPVLGIEMIVKPTLDAFEMGPKHSMLFYARSTEGLSELYGWSTIAAGQGNAITRDDVWEMSDQIVKVVNGISPQDLIERIEHPLFMELNPSSRALQMLAYQGAGRHKLMLLPTSDVYYPLREHHTSAELMGVQMKPSPQWMLTRAESRFYSSVPADAWDSHALLREMCKDVQLVKAENIKHAMDLEATARASIKRKVKRWTKAYESRLVKEVSIIQSKGFADYFAMLCELCRYAKSQMLMGPARGSSAGSLLAFLLDITEVDPLIHDLMFERFIDESRYDLPDVDLDFPDDKREMVFDYLRRTYGADNVSHVGTISRLKAKSALTQVAIKLNIPPWETEEVKHAAEAHEGDLTSLLTEVDAGKRLIAKHPVMMEAIAFEDHAWHSGVHAAGALVCNVPVRSYCTVSADGTAQLDKRDAEKINLMKVDLLGIRTLRVIGETGVDVRNIPLNDPAVFALLTGGSFAGVFQFEGAALQSVCNQMGVDSFEDIVAITSLARPGPLHSGGTAAYIKRSNGDEPIECVDPIYDRICSKTLGMIVYQEQVMRVLREVGQMEWADVQTLRSAMTKSLGPDFFDLYRERFIAGARKNRVSEDTAVKIWKHLMHFGSYGFNRSHAVSYAIISYWCAWLKVYHPLTFAVAALKHADSEPRTVQLLREIINEGSIECAAFDPDHSMESWTVHDGKILAGLTSIRGIGSKTAATIVRNRAAGKLTSAQRAKLDHPELLFGDLFPAARLFGHVYADPNANGIRGSVSYIRDITVNSEGSVAVIARITSKDVRDMNESQSLARRGGKRIDRANLYLNLELEDDTDKIYGTVGRYDYDKPIGREICDAPKGSWWVLRATVRKGHRKLQITNAKRLA